MSNSKYTIYGPVQIIEKGGTGLQQNNMNAPQSEKVSVTEVEEVVQGTGYTVQGCETEQTQPKMKESTRRYLIGNEKWPIPLMEDYLRTVIEEDKKSARDCWRMLEEWCQWGIADLHGDSAGEVYEMLRNDYRFHYKKDTFVKAFNN